MTDTINVTTAGTLNDIQVFLAIQHTYTPDLDISLKAPNGISVVLSNDNGGDAAGVIRNNGYLTIFDDTTGPLIITSTLFLAPWSNYVKPQTTMGTFGGTPTNGDWVITIGDDVSGQTGLLLGWGIRLNNSLIVGSGNLSNTLPSRFNLYQNYPNPFNPVTNIKFDLPKNTEVKLKVYDLLGREVKTLLDEFKEAGTHVVEFDASEYASGVYFYKIEAGDYINTKKLILLK
jgi:subtilisin-like proprotein convertase family protein